MRAEHAESAFLHPHTAPTEPRTQSRDHKTNPPPLSMGAGRGGGAFLYSSAAAHNSPSGTCIASTAMLFGARPTGYRALSSAVEHYLDTVGVASLILSAPTISQPTKTLYLSR